MPRSGPRLSKSGEGTLTPVLVVASLTEEGDEATSYWNAATAEFQRPEDHGTMADRVIHRNFTTPPVGWLDPANYDDSMFAEYMVNEACVWEYGECSGSGTNRITEDTFFYADHLHSWLQRHSIDGDCVQPNCLDFRVKVISIPMGPSWDPSALRVYVDVYAQMSTLGHEFSHGVINEEVPVTYNGMGDQLGDAFGNMISMHKENTTGHWCYHNYPDYPAEEECTWDHIWDTSRCTMLSGDTVGYRPAKDATKGSVEGQSPGIAFNVYGPTWYGYESPAPVSKAFELFNLDRWIDPNAGGDTTEYCNGGTSYPAKTGAPVTYYNGFELSGAVSLEKTAKWWYRFVTSYLSAVGERHWSTAGPNLIAAAWSLFNDATFTATERDKAIRSVQAAGMRTSTSVIPGHLGSRLRQAAFWKGSTLYLFYSRPSDNRIVYQKLPFPGSWTAPVAFASASTSTGLDAYEHPNGETRVVFRSLGTNTVAYLKVYANGSVSPSVFLYSDGGGCTVTSSFAPSALHDGTRELIFTTSSTGTVRTTRLDTCETIQSTGIPRVRGVSVTKFNGQTYLIGTVQSGQGSWDNHQVITRLQSSTFQFVHLSSVANEDDQGYVTCRNYGPVPVPPFNPAYRGCFSYLNAAGTTPNLYGVSMPPGREGFARIYAGWASDAASFLITRLGIRVFFLINYLPTKRTRILPTDSGDPNNTSEVEFLQGGNALYVFEHDRIHTWMLY